MLHIDCFILCPSVSRTDLHEPQQLISLLWHQYNSEQDDEEHDDPTKFGLRDFIAIANGGQRNNYEVHCIMKLQEGLI